MKTAHPCTDMVVSFARAIVTLFAVLAPVSALAQSEGNIATVSFGIGLNTVVPPPGNGEPNHHVLPETVRIKKGGVVNFMVAGFHQIVAYTPGTTLNDIIVPATGTFIDDKVEPVLPRHPSSGRATTGHSCHGQPLERFQSSGIGCLPGAGHLPPHLQYSRAFHGRHVRVGGREQRHRFGQQALNASAIRPRRRAIRARLRGLRAPFVAFVPPFVTFVYSLDRRGSRP
jgi:hypothetical protein